MEFVVNFSNTSETIKINVVYENVVLTNLIDILVLSAQSDC